MAIKVNFAGTTYTKPGGWGMTKEAQLKMHLVMFLTRLGVKTHMSGWPEYG